MVTSLPYLTAWCGSFASYEKAKHDGCPVWWRGRRCLCPCHTEGPPDQQEPLW